MKQGLHYEAPEKRQEVGLRTRSLRGPKTKSQQLLYSTQRMLSFLDTSFTSSAPPSFIPKGEDSALRQVPQES